MYFVKHFVELTEKLNLEKSGEDCTTFMNLCKTIGWLNYDVSIVASTLMLIRSYPTNTTIAFHVETTWKRSFSRRFNLEYTWLCL